MPVYFAPIYIEIGYIFNPVQETSKRDCICVTVFHDVTAIWESHKPIMNKESLAE